MGDAGLLAISAFRNVLVLSYNASAASATLPGLEFFGPRQSDESQARALCLRSDLAARVNLLLVLLDGFLNTAHYRQRHQDSQDGEESTGQERRAGTDAKEQTGNHR